MRSNSIISNIAFLLPKVLKSFCVFSALIWCMIAQGQSKLPLSAGVKWSVNPASRNNLAFVANAGQNNNAIEGVDGKEILFSIDDNCMSVYFTRKGVYYKLCKNVELTEEQWEEFAKKNNIQGGKEGDEGRGKEILKTSLIRMDWNGSNAEAELIGEEKTSYYFNYYDPTIAKDKIIGNVLGYKKLIYRNIYPGIDIEYTIHPERGIKYSLVLHPGADPSVIKMDYSGAEVEKDAKGNIFLTTETGTITDHAPITYKAESGNKVESSFEKQANLVRFSIAGNTGSVTETTIIDPWVSPSPLPGFSGCKPVDIAVDGSNNVIINGTSENGGGANETQKYNSAGTLQWTLDMIANFGYRDNLQGDVQADNSNNIYLSPGLLSPVSTPYNTLSVDPTGTVLRWGSNAPTSSTNNMYEVWTLTFDCGKKNLYQSGGGLYTTGPNPELNSAASETINSTTGVEGTLYTTPAYGEIVSSCYAPNGNIYQLVADSNKGGVNGYNIGTFGAHDRIIIVNPGTGTIINSSATDYSASDGSNKNIYSVGYNGIGASCFYVYTTNGLFLDQRSLTTGALIKRISIPSGDSAQLTGHRSSRPGQLNSGIVFDSCGNVYVGAPGKVVEYDENLNFIGNAATGLPGTVFDMEMGKDHNIYATGGDTTGNAFVTQITPPACNGLPVTFTPITCSAPNSGTATANPQFAGPPFTYKWSDGQTTQTATGLSAGTYTVTVKGSPQCPTVYIETATVTIPAIPGANVTINVTAPTICSGSSTTLTEVGGVGGTTYSWSSGGNGTSTTVSPATTTTYTLTAVTGTCTVTPTAVVTVNTTPTVTPISISPSATVCSGQTVTLSTGGAATYTWSTGQTSSSITVTPAAGTYTYSVTGANGACNSAPSPTVTVTVNPTPTITTSALPSSTICSGSSTQLTASPGGLASYSWSPNGGTLTNTTFDTTTASPTVTTTYSVTATTAAGCSNATPATIIINVNASPTVTINAAPSTAICSGTSTTLTASGVGGGGTYAWSPGGGTTSSITVSPTITTTYTVTGTSAAGCSNSNSTQTIVVNVTATPSVSIIPASPGVCAGDTAILTANSTVPGTTFLWNTGSTTDTIQAHPSSTTTYTVTGTNGSCTGSASVTVTVGAITVTATAGSSTICSGDTTTITAGGASLYKWSTGSTNSVITVSPTTSTTYTVTGTSGSGCSATDTVVINVNPSPTITVSSNAASVCNGDTTLAFPVITGGGVPPYTYSWTGGQTTDTAKVVAGTYTVTITDANSCLSNTATVTIGVKTITVSATSSAPGNTICAGSSTLLTASGATNYIWTPTTPLTTSTYDTTTANPAVTTTFSVLGSSGNCKDSTTLVVTVTPLPVISANASSHTICTGGTGAILTASGASSYTWSPNTSLSASTGSPVTANPPANVVYTVTGTTGNCSNTATDTINVVVTPSVTISLSTVGDTACLGQSVTLTANGSAGTYVWNNGNTNSSITVTVTGPTSYSVIAKNGICADTSAKQPINVYPPITLQSISDSSCIGKNGTVHIIPSGGKLGYTYAWSNGITGADSLTVKSDSTVTYTCTVTDACGSTATGSATVLAFPPSKVSFTAVPDTVQGGQYVSFTNNTIGGASYYWTFGNGVTSTDFNPYVQYLSTGSYIVTLIARNSVCSDTAMDTVYVIETIFIPNVFTPNGDGVNDVFHVTMTSMEKYNIEIFNRWGQRVFTSDSPNIDWNGRSESGVMESDGGYYYIITATDYAGKNYKYHGYLQLIGGGASN